MIQSFLYDERQCGSVYHFLESTFWHFVIKISDEAINDDASISMLQA